MIFEGIYNSTPETPVTGKPTQVQLDADGNLKTVQGVGATSLNVLSVANNTFGTIKVACPKASAGNVYSIMATNSNATVRYLQLHNKATAPVATDVPVLSIPIPAGTVNNPGAILLDSNYFGKNGRRLSVGVSWAISDALATYTAGATASDHNLEINYI